MNLPSSSISDMLISLIFSKSAMIDLISSKAFCILLCTSSESVLACPTLAFAISLNVSSLLANSSKFPNRNPVPVIRECKLFASEYNFSTSFLASLALFRMVSASLKIILILNFF